MRPNPPPTGKSPSQFRTVMSGPSWSAESGYRYVFNGKEGDQEGLGWGLSTYDYGFRIYNASLGRFFSVDLLTAEYPWYSSYSFAGCKPVLFVDIDGREKGFEMSTRRDEEMYLKGTFKNPFHPSTNFQKSTDTGIHERAEFPRTHRQISVTELQLCANDLACLRRNSESRWAKQVFISALNKEISEEEYKERRNARAVGGVTGGLVVPIVAAIVYCGGQVTSPFPASSIASNLSEGVIESTNPELVPVIIPLSPASLNPASHLILAVAEEVFALSKAGAVVAKGISGRNFDIGQLQEILKSSGDNMITLYRGVTGREGNPGPLFLTDDAGYVTGYSDNVQTFTISRSGFSTLINEGLVESYVCLHATTGARGCEINVVNEGVKKAIPFSN